MAVALSGTPIGGGDFNPVYNPIVWYFESGNTVLPGFRYVVDLFEKTGVATQELITRLEIPPRPSDNICVADVGKILSNYVTSQNPNDLFAIDATDSYIRYNIEVRERYNVSYGWTSYEESLTSTDYPNFTQLNFAVATPFLVGDQILNILSSNDEPLLSGVLTVIDVIDAQTIVVNRQFSILNEATAPTGVTGDTIFADGTKFTSEPLLTVEDKLAWNGALSHFDLLTYTPDTYLPFTPDPAKFLTYLPQSGFRVRENSNLGMLFLNDNASGRRIVISDGFTVKFKDLSSTDKSVIYIPVGPGNIDEASYTYFSGPVVDITSSPSKFYDFWVTTSDFTEVTEKYRLNLDYTCTKWDEFQLMFLDRLGSLGSFPFYYLHEFNQTIQREENTFTIGDLNTFTGEWDFNSTDTSRKLNNINLQRGMRLNTAWLTQDESVYIQQLFSSGQVWLNIEGNNFPLIITNTNSVTRDSRSQKNIRYEISISFANNDNINW